MTTRRNVGSSGKEQPGFDETNKAPTGISSSSSKSDISPAVPASVIIKLLAFTVAMVGGPIGTYYLTLSTIFKGNSTFAGAMAAIMANVVLIAYIIVAMREDQSERIKSEKSI